MERKCNRHAFNLVTVYSQHAVMITCATLFLPFRAALEFSFPVGNLCHWLVGQCGRSLPPVGAIDATFGQLNLAINCAGARSYTQAHRHALSLRTVQIIDSRQILALSPLTVATFIRAPPVSLLLFLDSQLVTALARQRIHCCCRTITQP